MKLLEYYHNQQHFSDNYVIRKCQLPIHGDINLYGVRGSGKTAIVLDLVIQEDLETTLYIDMQDPNLIFTSLKTLALQQYIDKYHIKLLILDHYKDTSLSSFPNVERLIVLSRISLQNKTLTPVELFPWIMRSSLLLRALYYKIKALITSYVLVPFHFLQNHKKMLHKL